MRPSRFRPDFRRLRAPTRAASHDGRVEAPWHEKAIREWTRLELDPKSGKVDHPPGGSKDLSDAMTGVIYGLTLQTEVWTMFEVSPSEFPPELMAAALRDDEDE